MKNARKIYFSKGPDVPNNTLPVLLYRSVLAANAPAKARRFHERFRDNGWAGLWTDTIYDYMHFHSNAHEVLGIANGKAEAHSQSNRRDQAARRLRKRFRMREMTAPIKRRWMRPPRREKLATPSPRYRAA